MPSPLTDMFVCLVVVKGKAFEGALIHKPVTIKQQRCIAEMMG